MTKRLAWRGAVVCGLAVLCTLYAWERLWRYQAVLLLLLGGLACVFVWPLIARAMNSAPQMPVKSRKGPPWWIRTIFAIVYAGSFAGLVWGKGWWQNRWTAFSAGLAYALMFLVVYWRVPDRKPRSRGSYFGLAVLFLVLAALDFTMFFVGGKGVESTFAFIMLALGLRSLYMFSLASPGIDDLGIVSLRLNNH